MKSNQALVKMLLNCNTNKYFSLAVLKLRLASCPIHPPVAYVPLHLKIFFEESLGNKQPRFNGLNGLLSSLPPSLPRLRKKRRRDPGNKDAMYTIT